MVAVLCVALNPALDQTIRLAHLVPGQVHRALDVHLEAGGKALNVASCLADFGVPSLLTGALGQDNAAPFEALMARKEIQDRCLRVPGATRTNLKLVEASRETTDINLPGAVLAAEQLVALFHEVHSAMDALVEGGWVVLSGSLPPGLPEDTYASLITQAKKRGLRVLLDASGKPLARAAFGGVDVLKPNRHELSDLVGQPLEHLEAVREAAQALMARPGAPSLLVVSLGTEGALFLEGGACLRVLPLEVEAQSSVGAGDAMVAGILAARILGLDLRETAALATAFAVVKLERLGPHLAEPEAVWHRARQVRFA